MVRRAIDADARRVGDGDGTRGVGADIVACDIVVGAMTVVDAAVDFVARDDVAFASGGAANDVMSSSGVDFDTVGL